MKAGYRHHVFVSYSRKDNVPEWLREHFLPLLINRLGAVLGEDPDIFCDQRIEVGSDWPDALAEALNRSCCMLAVWSPRYFRSPWCIAEWETMLAREKQLGLKTDGSPGLVYPVVYSDGDYFPEAANRTQQKIDLREYSYPYPQFRNSEKYLVFHDRVAEIANDLEGWLRLTPAWSADWISLRPDVAPLRPPRFRRL
jgi:hypothetical protein